MDTGTVLLIALGVLALIGGAIFLALCGPALPR
jgi:hypothetical protein